PPPKFRAGELLAKVRGRKVGIPVVPIHRAVLTKQQDAVGIPKKIHPHNAKAQRLLAENMRMRAACLFATDCHRGCSVGAAFDSTTVFLRPALKTGNLDILPNAMAQQVSVDPSGKANGVTYIDKVDGSEHRVSGKVVVLAASTGETARLLLNSKSSRFPDGLGNSSGKAGKYITDSVSSRFSGQIPALENLPIHNEDGVVGQQVYVPWWKTREQLEGKLDFPGGFKFVFSSGRDMPSLNTGRGFDWLSDSEGILFGKQLKKDARRYYGSMQGIGAQGAMAANDDCYCELDPELKDQWGIPVLRFHWKYSEDELKQVAHQQEMMAELLSSMGARFNRPPDSDDPLKAVKEGGRTIHEVGGAIMGSSPKDSVCDSWCRVWDAPNVLIADGAAFPGTADKNPTLTIMALAWRTADHLISEMKKGNI
ncbi:MAG: GMC family oxidoreductase, partial [Verrucomicrobiae bacterium]|nr:GMC family oxidoreductase [Verrucomicrobiae bacterium]